MSTPVNNCLQNICTTVAVIAPQVQNQDPISPSGRGRHNTGKDGKVRVSSVVASNLFQLEQILLCHLRERQRGANRSPQASISWWGEAGWLITGTLVSKSIGKTRVFTLSAVTWQFSEYHNLPFVFLVWVLFEWSTRSFEVLFTPNS